MRLDEQRLGHSRSKYRFQFRTRAGCVLVLLAGAAMMPLRAAEPSRTLEPRLWHLRAEGPREWSEFPENADAPHLTLDFDLPSGTGRWTIALRQQDIKQTWNVLLNATRVGRLDRDENDMLVYFEIPDGVLTEGTNTLRIEQESRGTPTPDDVRVGQIVLYNKPLSEVLGEATVEIEVVDADTREHLPARLTLVNERGALQTTSATSNRQLAVRPGTVYTADGKASFSVPAGKYTVYAGRGFEYSLASTTIDLTVGEATRERLAIRREVPTEGYVACDTHIHTLTHSGHGDATAEERMITLAGEGIELAIATDHNVHIDFDPLAREMNLRRYFTPVIGNEVTTGVGHFNIFPVRAGAAVPDHTLADWGPILDSIYRTPDVKVAILNHARDVHRGTRPFGPELFNAVVGENVAGWPMRFNAMEVVNSGATQTDGMRLFHDWMGLLNRGRRITPVGSSDSHDVARHFVGQGRTYIRTSDRDPGNIDVDTAINNFLQGRVMVSYGLLVELLVDDKYRSGELATVPDEEVKVVARVLGPHWVTATKVTLFANGQPIRESSISASSDASLPRGVKWLGEWSLPKPSHDVHLVAIATGPGIDGLYWKTAKPYQPTSPDWQPYVIGCSGAVWLDADGDGRPTAAYDYAERLLAASGGDLERLLDALAGYDAAVAAQAAHLYQSAHESLISDRAQSMWKRAAPEVRAGFGMYIEAWRENQIAAVKR